MLNHYVMSKDSHSQFLPDRLSLKLSEKAYSKRILTFFNIEVRKTTCTEQIYFTLTYLIIFAQLSLIKHSTISTKSPTPSLHSRDELVEILTLDEF